MNKMSIWLFGFAYQGDGVIVLQSLLHAPYLIANILSSASFAYLAVCSSISISLIGLSSSMDFSTTYKSFNVVSFMVGHSGLVDERTNVFYLSCG